jgi:carbon-monoxide dehydrogenase large subunit
MAMDGEGRFLALRVNLIANLGAYTSQYGPFIPYLGVTMSTGVYDIPAIDVNVTCIYTNTVPVDAYRGAGRPEAAFLLEKLVDECARDLGLRARRSAGGISSRASPIGPRRAASTIPAT